jgi:hypothetical protein
MRRIFYKKKKKKGFYIAEFLNPETGARLCFRNTQARNRDEALLVAALWQQDGIPKVKKGRQPVFQPRITRTLDAIIDLRTILKTLEKLPDLDAAGALQIAEVLRTRGLLEFPPVKAGPGRVDFIEYLESFWDYDASPYVKDKIAHNYSIDRRYCHGTR